MAIENGRDFLLKMGAVSGSPVNITALTETSVSINNEQVDITNKDTGGFRTLLENAGVRSVEITASGRLDDGSSASQLRGYAVANTINTFSLFYEDGSTVEGLFAISSYSNDGSEGDAMNYSVTLQSSGQVTFVEN